MTTQNENNASENKVIASLSKFVSDICFDGDFRNHPEYLNEIFEHLLETEPGNSLPLRIKMLSCIRTSKMLVKALEPFTDEEIHKACTENRNY
ncbi:hypothetical protein [Flavobacterium ginsenosidimutans]|uniref:Uncharacterized protein n=1 Tax=Flavobacterium ginsenosidimutans TaxID=687844 RepID=A0ABZ2QEX5_9FLAO|nr:hypothetical protein [Flavobacterium ginsenosidimutans]KAF2332391.1 hypothetical protein DM444_10560 [Flavobacterium ginsenosidimutans]